MPLPLLSTVGPLAKMIGGIVDKAIPDKDMKEKLKHELDQYKEQESEFEILLEDLGRSLHSISKESNRLLEKNTKITKAKKIRKIK